MEFVLQVLRGTQFIIKGVVNFNDSGDGMV